MPNPKVSSIDATWTAAARAELERFVATSRIAGGVLSLAKKDDVPEGSRWLYAVYSGERIQPMQAALAKHGYPLLYALDGITVAVSNSNHIRELDGTVIDLDGPGYLLVRPHATAPAPR
ncbi:MAG TPA: hypothetical protein VHH11_12345 [Gammaproteobacteria bacterium]|jgi:hypothetical protein|nr:hypothetical protein [Gammaproteobacteria bacterium]